jgi:hypothetical protein
MPDDPTKSRTRTEATLAEKYRMFLEGLSDEEFELYRTSVGLDDHDETEGFAFDITLLQQKIGVSQMATVFQDVTVNKAKTADKAYQAMDGYIKS